MLAVVVGVFILVVERAALVDWEVVVQVVMEPMDPQDQSILAEAAVVAVVATQVEMVVQVWSLFLYQPHPIRARQQDPQLLLHLVAIPFLNLQPLAPTRPNYGPTASI